MVSNFDTVHRQNRKVYTTTASYKSRIGPLKFLALLAPSSRACPMLLMKTYSNLMFVAKVCAYLVVLANTLRTTFLIGEVGAVLRIASSTSAR